MTRPFGARPLRGLVFALFAMALVAMARTPVAHADVVVIVPPHVEQGIRDDVVDTAVETLTRALKVDGFDVISPGQAASAIEADQRRADVPLEIDPLQCVSAECAFEFRRLFDAVFTVQVSIFRESNRAMSLRVTLVEEPHAYFTGSAEIGGGDVSGALRAAYREARAKQAEGVGPWLTVTGEPAGAVAYLDGNEFGRIPITRRRVAPGVHRLEVRADGYTSHHDTVDVPERIDHEESRAVTLVPLSAGDRPVARRRTAADWVLGSLFVAGGLVYAGAGVRDYLKDGDCAERERGTCVREYEASTVSTLKLGLGGASVLLGGALWWWAPVGLYTQADRTSARVTVRTTF